MDPGTFRAISNTIGRSLLRSFCFEVVYIELPRKGIPNNYSSRNIKMHFYIRSIVGVLSSIVSFQLYCALISLQKQDYINNSIFKELFQYSDSSLINP